MCVPGAMAATSAAMVSMKPADAARAPDGRDEDRRPASCAAIMREMMSRVESTRPPGVRSVKTTSAAPARSARSIVSIMYSAETGWMMLSTTGGVDDGPALSAGCRYGEVYPCPGGRLRTLVQSSAQGRTPATDTRLTKNVQ